MLRHRSPPTGRKEITMLALAVSGLVAFAGFSPLNLATAAVPLPLHPSGTAVSLAGAGQAGMQDPTYDEQIGMSFTQNMSSISYNVTALAQMDADGYGPAYIINGLTSAGYWYQVGISYHWPSANGNYDPTFGFSYQVYGPNGKPVFPGSGGAGLTGLSKVVRSGDTVLLTLFFSGTVVQMQAQDWNTGATAKTSFNAFGATTFVGTTSQLSNGWGFFSGIMTEWYHLAPYSGNEGKVTYTSKLVTLSSAWLWIDEFDTAHPSSRVFVNQTQSPVTFASDQQLHPFASNGATMYASAHVFITGLLNAASSHVALLSAAVPDPISPSFYASFTLAGLAQRSDVPAGSDTVIEADPGTQVTVYVNASSSTATDKWVFSTDTGTNSSFTFKAGSNQTYAYYHLVQQKVSYQVPKGNTIPSSSAPAIVFMTAPSTPSPVRAPAPATQVLGNSPTEIFALFGSNVSVNGSIAGATGVRWASNIQSWTITGPDVLPNPIQFFYQYRVSISYAVLGGGLPPVAPTFESLSFGYPTDVQVSSENAAPPCLQAGCSSAGSATGWFDAGSWYKFTGIINGSSSGERWVSRGSSSAPAIISNPDAVLSQNYTHQYRADFAVNDARGGSVSRPSGWLDAGSALHASANSNQQWQFQLWNGTGPGAYSGPNPSIDLTVNGPLSERATFYVQLDIETDPGTSVAYSDGAQSGIVSAGTTKTIYVPPSSNVTLRASPSAFFYSFSSWQGSGAPSARNAALSLAVRSPTAIRGTSSLNYAEIIGGAAAVALIVLVGSLLFLRSRRRKDSFATL